MEKPEGAKVKPILAEATLGLPLMGAAHKPMLNVFVSDHICT